MSEIRERLNKILNRVEELENAPSELAKDALLADLRNLYDSVKATAIDVKSIKVPEAKAEPVIKESPKKAEPAAVAEPVVEPVVEVPVKKEEPVVELPVVTKEAAVEEVVVEPVVEKAAKEPKAVPTTEPVAIKKPLIGKEETRAETADQNTLGGQLNRKPLEDLRSGIPLNEKFGIIRGLFKGNASDFGDAVLKLNNAVNVTEMTHYLNLLQQRFEWDVESEAYKNFYIYIERKMLTLKPSNANADK